MIIIIIIIKRVDLDDCKEVEELNLTNYWCSGWDELLHLVESI